MSFLAARSIHPMAGPIPRSVSTSKDYSGQTIICDRRSMKTNEPTSCCDAGDVVKTKFKVEPRGSLHPQDTWFAWLKGKWVRIPPEKIVPDYAPDGQAYLFMLTIANAYEIVCFVRPNGGL